MIRMEGNKGGRVGVGEDDMGDGMQCSDHPYRNNPGGICAVCLQEKLAKLVSSSFPLPIRASSSSSSSPSFRSNIATSSTTMRPCSSITATVASAAPPSSSLALSVHPTLAQRNGSSESDHDAHHRHEYYTRRTRLPLLLAKKKKKKTSASANSDIILKRSKSTVTPRRNHSLVDADEDTVIEDLSPRKRNGFWSFLYLSSKSSASTKKLKSKSFRDSSATSKSKEKCSTSLGRNSDIVVEEDNSPNSNTTTASASSFERKISRSRSVGCGSRSFSGDFFERISTGFGDCTLRRVESQREGKPKVAAAAGGAAMNRDHCMKERVRCAGIFSGFMMTSSSSSSSSSSSYWVSSSADDTMNGKSATVALSHGRARSWGWAFASPMRAFTSKPSSKDNNRRHIIRDANDKNATPNFSAIPSLLAVGG